MIQLPEKRPIIKKLNPPNDKANEARVRPFLQFIGTKTARNKTLELGFIPR